MDETQKCSRCGRPLPRSLAGLSGRTPLCLSCRRKAAREKSSQETEKKTARPGRGRPGSPGEFPSAPGVRGPEAAGPEAPPKPAAEKVPAGEAAGKQRRPLTPEEVEKLRLLKARRAALARKQQELKRQEELKKLQELRRLKEERLRKAQALKRAAGSPGEAGETGRGAGTSRAASARSPRGAAKRGAAVGRGAAKGKARPRRTRVRRGAEEPVEPESSSLLGNRKLLIGVAAGVIGLVVLIFAFSSGGGNESGGSGGETAAVSKQKKASVDKRKAEEERRRRRRAQALEALRRVEAEEKANPRAYSYIETLYAGLVESFRDLPDFAARIQWHTAPAHLRHPAGILPSKGPAPQRFRMRSPGPHPPLPKQTPLRPLGAEGRPHPPERAVQSGRRHTVFPSAHTTWLCVAESPSWNSDCSV